MRQVSAARSAWVLIVALLAGYQLWTLWLAPGRSATTIQASIPPLEVPLVDGASAAQSFRIGADSLERLAIAVAPTARPAQGQLIITLEVQQDEAWRPLFRVTEAAGPAVTKGFIPVAFPRQPDSREHVYRVALRGVGIPSHTPVVLLASRHAGEPSHQFWVNDTERWGDLALVAETAPSPAYRRLRPLFPRWPDWAIATVLALVVAVWDYVFALALWRALEPDASPPSDQLTEPSLVT